MLEAFRHFVHAAGYSAAGMRHMFTTQIAARMELGAGVAAFLWLLLLRRSVGEIFILMILFCVVFAIEALNTSIERIIDQLSPQTSEFARIAKDLGSAGVFFSLLAAGIYVLALSADAAGFIAFWPASQPG